MFPLTWLDKWVKYQSNIFFGIYFEIVLWETLSFIFLHQD